MSYAHFQKLHRSLLEAKHNQRLFGDVAEQIAKQVETRPDGLDANRLRQIPDEAQTVYWLWRFECEAGINGMDKFVLDNAKGSGVFDIKDFRPLCPFEAAYEKMAGITAGYDIEVGLVRSGEDIAIIPGGTNSIRLTGYDEALAHTHPSGVLEFSPDDLISFARDYPGQTTSVLVGPDGTWRSLPIGRP